MSQDLIDFGGLAAALLDHAEQLLADWLPGGEFRGNEYVCYDLTGGEGGRVSVNVNTGVWADFAGDDKGGDLTSLFAAIHNLNQGQAARRLMTEYSWLRPSRASPAASRPPPARAADAGGQGADQVHQAPDDAPAPAEPRRRAKSPWVAIAPVPDFAPRRPKVFRWPFQNKVLDQWVELEAVRHWTYEFNGQLYGHVARFERFDSEGVLQKETIPFTWCEDTSDPDRRQNWHRKTWEAPRPLYVPAGLLSGTPADVPVVVVEGEKCAEAGHTLLGHEYDFVSWPGGGKAWAVALWVWLTGRTVYLWPDCDAKRFPLTKAEREAGVDPASKAVKPESKQPGMMAMVGIGSHLLAKHGCKVLMCPIPVPLGKPDGWDIADAIEQGWDAAKVRDFIRSARVFVPPDETVRAAVGMSLKVVSTPSMAAAGEGGDADDGVDVRAWVNYLVSTDKGAARPVRENVVLALDGRPDKGVPGIAECAGLIAFNEFTNNVEKLRPTPWGTLAGDWMEADELLMGDWLLREHGLPSMARALLEEAVLIVARRHSYHPLRERVVALRGKWDGCKRVDTWLRRCMLEEDEWDDRQPLQRYLTLAGRWFVMAMCARVLPEKRVGPLVVVGPGTKFDFMLILEGPQGWGKSTVAGTLGGEYFADTGLTIGEKDSLMNIQGIWIYEWGELENLSRQEVGKVKLFVSSPADRFRATFDRRPAKYPRQVVFVGTTNESHYLTDTTGNRRFWPVRVTRPPDVEWLRENLEQMLAEAVALVDAGERFWPTREEQKELFDPQQQARTVESSLEGVIKAYLYDENQKVPVGQANGSMLTEISLTDLLGRVGYTIDKQTDAVVKKTGALMHMLGWEVRRASADESGKRPRVYVRPKERAKAAPSASPLIDSPAQGHATDGAADECPF